MEWTAAIGPVLSGGIGALLLWASQASMKAWGDRQKARQNREDEEDLLHHSRRVLIDEVGRLRALCRHHNVPEDEIGALVEDPWERRGR